MAADTAVLALRVDNGQYIRGTDKAAASTNRLKTSGISVKKVLGALGLALVGRQMIRFSREAFRAAVAAEEIANKYNTVFETLPIGSERVAREFAKNFGLAQSSAEELLGGTGDLLVGFGFSEKAALDLSKKVNELSVDLASFQNLQGGSKRASEALTKALLGETESAKSLGIVIRQNTEGYRSQVKQVMETQGVTETQAKAITNLEIAYKQSSKAVGDFARTQSSTANQLRQAGEAWKDLKEAVGEAFLAILEVAGPDTAKIIDWIKGVAASIRSNILVIKEFAIRVKTAFQAVGKTIAFLTSPLTTFGENVATVGVWIFNNWKKLWKGMGEVIQITISEGLRFLQNATVKFFDFIDDPSLKTADAILEALKPTDAAQRALDRISVALDLDKIKLKKPTTFKAFLDDLEKLNAKAAKDIEKLYTDAFKKVVEDSKKSKDLLKAEGKTVAAEVSRPRAESANLATAAAEGSAEAVKILARTQRGGPEERTAKNTESIDKTLKRSLGKGMALVPVNLGAQ